MIFMKNLIRHIYKIILPAIVIVITLFFLSAVSNIQKGADGEGKVQLERSLKKAIVACYSIEGAYPASIEYLIDNYNIVYNEDKYVIKYDYFASNLIPDITVLEQSHE
jgi:hypothetical protein